MNLNNFLITITNLNIIEPLKKARISNFLFPLKQFCVGIEKTFTLNEIIEENSFLFINRILDEPSYLSLKEVFLNLPSNIKGIVFEDFGIITLAKEINLNVELILSQSHFGTNYQSINENLAFVNSVVISTDITKEEIEHILKEAKKPLVYNLFGLIPGMYSRRTLLKNFEIEYKTKKENSVLLTEQVTKREFIAVENEFGTVLYHGKYLNGILNAPLENIKFYWIHPLLLSNETILRLLDYIVNKKEIDFLSTDDGFLNRKTIYRLGEKNK